VVAEYILRDDRPDTLQNLLPQPVVPGSQALVVQNQNYLDPSSCRVPERVINATRPEILVFYIYVVLGQADGPLVCESYGLLAPGSERVYGTASKCLQDLNIMRSNLLVLHGGTLLTSWWAAGGPTRCEVLPVRTDAIVPTYCKTIPQLGHHGSLYHALDVMLGLVLAFDLTWWCVVSRCVPPSPADVDTTQIGSRLTL